MQRKKVYLALLAAGGTALLVDRILLSESATTPALAFADAKGQAAGATPNSPDNESPGSSIPEIPFPRGMTRYDPQSTFLDVFAPPGSPLRRQSRLEAAGGSLPDEFSRQRGHATAGTFASRHQLDGVMEHLRLKIAVIDGVPVRVGQTLDGCALERVSGFEVSVRCEDGTVVLKVNRPAMSKRD